MRSPSSVKTALVVILLAVTMAGCVDMLTNKEVLTESAWYGRLVDGHGMGIANATVTLHVLNNDSEVYERQAQTATSEPVRGMYTFDHIEIRDGADRAYTTCNLTMNGRDYLLKGDVRPLIDGSRSRTSTMRVNDKNITIVSYSGAVNEYLIAK